MADPLEGTILSHGAGAGGSRTRGGHDVRRAQDRSLSTGGQSKQISGGRGINASSLGRVNTSGGMINPGRLKAAVHDFARATPVVTPQAIGHVGDLLTNAAFKYSERVANAAAESAIISYNDKVRKAFYGDPENGVSGFKDRQAESATETHSEFTASIEAITAETLGGLPDEARRKAMMRIQGAKQVALRRAADHTVRQQDVVDDNIRIRTLEDLTRELVVNPESLFGPGGGVAGGAMDRVLSLSNGDEKQARAMLDAMNLAAAKQRYFNDLESGSQEDAYANLKYFRDVVDVAMTTNGRNAIDSFVLQSHSALSTSRKQSQTLKESKAKDVKDRRYNRASNVAFGYDEDGNKAKGAKTYKDASELSNDFPGLPLRDAQKILDARFKYANQPSNRIEDLVGFQSALNDLRGQGNYFQSKEDLMQLGLAYGVKMENINASFTEGQDIISQDKEKLDGRVRMIHSELKRVFSGRSSISAGPITAEDWLARSSASSQALLGTEYNSILTGIHDIWQDDTKGTPSERASLIKTYMEDRINAARSTQLDLDNKPRKPIKISNFSADLDQLVGGYTVEHYVDTRKSVDEQSTVERAVSNMQDALATTSSLASRTAGERGFVRDIMGVSPTEKNLGKIDKAIRKANVAGYMNVHFQESGPVYGYDNYRGYVGSNVNGELVRLNLSGAVK